MFIPGIHNFIWRLLFCVNFLEQPFSFLDKIRLIVRLTRIHATNLAKFAFSYKLVTGSLEKLQRGRSQWHTLVSAFCVGYFVFGEYNGVNMQVSSWSASCINSCQSLQINLYLLSRILLALSRLAVQRRFIRRPNTPVFRWFAAAVWGVVLWLFEYHKPMLQPSLQHSMTYLYHDSNHWTCLRDFLLV